MNIKIDNKFSITSDDKNYILTEEKIIESGKTKGEKSITNVGYYRTLEQLFTEYKHLLIRRTSVRTFGELISALGKVDTTLQQIMLKMEGK